MLDGWGGKRGPDEKYTGSYCRVYGFGHLRADCRGPGSAPEPYGIWPNQEWSPENSMVKQQPKVVVTAAIVVVVVAVAVCDSVLCSASNSLVLEPLIVKMLTFNVGP